MEKILVIGAGGQLGTELTAALGELHGNENVIASDISKQNPALAEFPFQQFDVMDAKALADVVSENRITQIYHLAAILSAKGESNPQQAWHLNMNSLLNVLELARTKKLNKVYWPSSIAVFGPSTPQDNTPQDTIMDPNTIYGISKQAGERWCAYYHSKYGVDVRSLRYPGLIGYKSLPGGGTTDYAVEIFHKVLKKEDFTCFLSENTALPMMYMPDAIKATLDLMQAPEEKISVRSSYNLAGFSFTPKELVASIRKYHSELTVEYAPDFRQQIADSWPNSINDDQAKKDWKWQPDFTLDAMTQDILENLPDYM